MKLMFQRAFDIRKGEWLRAWLMFSYIFLIIASLMIVKPIRNSLFLTRFGAERLPYVYILVAIVAAFVVWLYSRFSGKVKLNVNIFYTFIFSIVAFVCSWLLLNSGYQGGWFLYAFYVWVTIFGVITGAQFWLLANYIFNAREARRLFGFIGAGGILGGIFGGYLTNYLARAITTHNLIFVCIGFLLICIVLLWIIWSHGARYLYREKMKASKKAAKPEPESLKSIIKNSRHIIYLGSIVGISVVVANLVDYQFSAIAAEVLKDEDSLTAFFGFWLSTLSVFSLAIQLLITGRALKYHGVTVSLLFLPLGILLGATAILIFPALWSAVIIKVTDGGFKHSINKAGLELLYLPIPVNIKNRAKAFIDIFVDNLATGVGGILLFALTLAFGLSVRHVSVVIVALVLVWCYLIYHMRREYINSFRHAIEKRTINLAEQTVNLQDASLVKSFIKVLDGNNERQILYVLNLFSGTQNKMLVPYFKKLINHPSPDIVTLVLKQALAYHELDLRSSAEKYIEHSNQDVRISAVNYVCEKSDDIQDKLTSLLNHDNLYIRGASLLYLAEKVNLDLRIKDKIKLRQYFEDIATNAVSVSGNKAELAYLKSAAARAAGIAHDIALYSYIHLFINDDDPDTVRQAILSAGKSKESEFIPVLIPFLGNKYLRRQAREALAEFGEPVILPLTGYLELESSDRNIKLAIPRVLSLIGSQKSVKLLLTHINQNDLLLRYEIIRALNRLKNKFPDIKIDKQAVTKGIYNETKEYYNLLTILNYRLSDIKRGIKNINEDNSGESAHKLLIRALNEKLDDNLERIFRLLGLNYMPQDMYNAYLGVMSRRSDLRADAIEFLDNVLEPKLKRLIIPIVESGSPELLWQKTQDIFRVELKDDTQCFEFILKSNDNWLKVCTLHYLTETGNSDYRNQVARMTNDYDPMIKETANRYIQSLTG